MKKIASLGLSMATLFLVSCSGGEPSVSDISDALEKAISAELDQINSMSKSLGGPTGAVDDMLKVKISNVEKVSCTESAKDTYSCNIRFHASGGILGKQGRDDASSVRMMRTSGGWMISR
jgi:hypothetical protein